MTIRRALGLLTVTALAAHAGALLAQGAFPAPLPGQAPGAFPAPLPGQGIQRNDPAFPPVNGAAPSASIGGAPSAPFPTSGAAPIMGGGGAGFGPPPASRAGAGPSEACMKGFMPLREDAERRGKLIKDASDRHSPPDVACKLIGSFGEAELKMINYVTSHQSDCGIPGQVADQLRNGHRNTEELQKKVCGLAQQQQQRGPAGPSLSEVLGSATAEPQATSGRKRGSTFDTLNGNVLSR